MVILRSHQEGYGSLVETPTLSIPFLDRVERALSCEIEHEENRDGVVADERQHVDKLALTSEIPNREGDLGIADGDGFLHKVDPFHMVSHRL